MEILNTEVTALSANWMKLEKTWHVRTELYHSVIFINENENENKNGEKQENNELVNENWN